MPKFVAPFCPLHLDRDQMCVGHACGAAAQTRDGWVCGLASSMHGVPRIVEPASHVNHTIAAEAEPLPFYDCNLDHADRF